MKEAMTWTRPEGCHCGPEGTDEDCPHHGRSREELWALVRELRARVAKLTDDVDGARRVAIEAERERNEAREKSARRGVLVWQAEQERDRAIKERDELKRDALLRRPSGPCPHEEERDRMRAALEPTKQNLGVVSALIDLWYSRNPPWTEPEKAASAILAALRDKAGLS